MDTNPNLTAEADFAASVFHDLWKGKGENYVIPNFQFHVSCLEDSTSSVGSISSSDLSDDALSPLSSSSSSSFSTPSLLSLSKSLQHPLKKGLSKYYQGKSQTFTSLSDVKCIEDLAKKENNYNKKDRRTSLSPKALISKKAARSSFSSVVFKPDS